MRSSGGFPPGDFFVYSKKPDTAVSGFLHLKLFVVPAYLSRENFQNNPLRSARHTAYQKVRSADRREGIQCGHKCIVLMIPVADEPAVPLASRQSRESGDLSGIAVIRCVFRHTGRNGLEQQTPEVRKRLSAHREACCKGF